MINILAYINLLFFFLMKKKKKLCCQCYNYIKCFQLIIKNRVCSDMLGYCPLITQLENPFQCNHMKEKSKKKKDFYKDSKRMFPYKINSEKNDFVQKVDIWYIMRLDLEHWVFQKFGNRVACG